MAKRILVPIGTSEGAEVIVPVVTALARDAGATVRLLNVQPLQRTRLGESASTLPLYGYDAGLTLEVQRRVLAFGDVVEEVAREAAAFDADLIAVSERRRPWWRPVLTRFVDRVRARARAPILTLSGAAR